MKCLRSNRRVLGFLMFALMLSWQIGQPLAAATVYWDLDGTVAGAGGPTPTGTWDAGSLVWNPLTDGTGAVAAWTAGDTAVFAAGTNATGSYAVNVSGTQSIGGLRFEEGAVTLSGGTLSLAAASGVFVNAGRSATLNSALSGSAALTKLGVGSLTLGGANTGFSGPVALLGGVTSISAANNLGDGSATNTLTLAGGTLQATSSFSLGAARGLIVGAGDGVIDVTDNNNLTVDGTLSAAAGLTGSVTLTKTGTGILTLSGTNNTAAVATTVTGGTVSIASNANLGAGRVTLNGGTLQATGSFVMTNGIALGRAGGTVNVPSSATTVQVGTLGILGPGSLTKTGAGILQLNIASTYAGSTTISDGTLAGGATSFLPARTQLSIASAGQLNMNGFTTTVASLAGAGTVANTGTPVALTLGNILGSVDSTFSGVFNATTAANLPVTKNGGGTLTLTNSGTAGTASGAWSLIAGTVKLDYANAGSQTGNILNSATALTLGGGTLNVTGRNAATVAQAFGNVTLSAGGSAIRMVPGATGSTTLTLGTVPVSGGTATTAGGALLVEAPAGTTVRVTTTDVTNSTYGGRIVFYDGSAYNWAANGGGTSPRTLTPYTGYTPLVASLSAPATNYLQTDTLTGGITASQTVNSLKITTANAGQKLDLNGNALTLANGGLLFTGAHNFEILTTGGAGTLKSGTATNSDFIVQQYGTGVLTLSAPIVANAGTSTLTKAGPGTLVLNAVNTYTGGTFISGGVLSISDNLQLGATAASVITISDGATLRTTTGDVNTGAHLFTLSGGNATVDIAPSTTLTVGGVISGAGGLSLNNTGTLLLTGVATYTGPTFIGAGATLRGGVTNFIGTTGSGLLNVAAGGTVDLNNFALVIGGIAGAGTITNSGGTAVTVSFGSTTNTASTNQDSTFSGTLSGALNIGKNGGGTLTLTNAATYTGTTAVTNGGIVFGVNNALPTGMLTLGSNPGPTAAFVDLNGFNWTSGAINLYGTAVGVTSQAMINLGASSVLTLGGTVTLSANTTTPASSALPAFINGGTIELPASRSFAIADSPNAAVDLTVSSVIASTAGAFGITKTGAGTLLLTSANTYTGTTTVSGAGGILMLGGTGTLGAGTGALTMTAGILDLNGTSQTVGVFTGAAGSFVRNTASGTLSTLTIGNGSLASSSGAFAGVLENGGGTLALVKNGAGLTTLSGANTYSGGTQVNEGTLVLANTAAQPATGTIQVASGATLGLGVGGAGFFNLANVDSLFANTLAGVSMAAGANVGIDTTAGDFDYSGSASAAGGRGLVKLGTGVLTLSGSNSHTGGTTISSGTLAITSDASLGASSGSLTMSSGTTLRLTGASTVSLTRPVITAGAATFDVADPAGSLAISSGFTPAAVTKTGAGTLRLTGTVTSSSTLAVSAGTLSLGGAYSVTGATTVGTAAGKATLNVGSGATLTGGTLSLGTALDSNGALNISGGTVNMTTPETTDTIGFGAANGGYGAFTISSGTFTQARFMFGGISTSTGAGGIGVGLITGGTVNTNGYIILSRAGASTGVLTITGGTINHTAATQNININYAGSGRGELNVAGGLIDNTGRNVTFGAGTSTGIGIANLNAGTLLTNLVTDTSGTSIVNFNGGTLKAAIATSGLVATNIDFAYVNGAFGTFTGGAVIDSNGFAITVPKALVAPTGNGVRTLALSASGSGYVGAPYVQITGDGSGATGYAVVDTDPLSPTVGTVTSIVITNPGVGYTTAPTITLVGGGGTGAAATGTLGANTSGGLTKVGDGTLTLTGVNTYTGATIVNGGTLSILPTAISSSSGVFVGQNGNGILDLNADAVGAAWSLASGAGLTLGGTSTTGTLGFQLGAVGASDTIVLNGGAFTVNAGGGFVNVSALGSFGVGNYDLITGATSIGGAGTLKLGALPTGYTYSLSQTATSVTLNVLGLAPAGDLYWTGTVNNSWGGLNGSTSNWATTANGTSNAGYAPGASNVVYFSATNASTSAFSTTLDSATSIKGLRIFNSGTGAVTIAAGTSGSLTVGTDGISVLTGAPVSTTISAPVVFNAAQTWNVADSGSTLTVSGMVTGGTTSGTVGLTITGAGAVSLTNNANTFTGDIAINGGTLIYTQGSATTTSQLGQGSTTDFKQIFLTNGGKFRVSGASYNVNVNTSTNRGAGAVFNIGAGGGTFEVDDGLTLTVDDGTVAGTGFAAAQLQGTGPLTKTGTGILVLRFQQVFGGTITIAQGTLRMSSTTAFGLNTAGTSILSGATLDLNDQAVADTEPLTIAGTGLASAPAGVITNSAVGSASFAGPITLAADSSIGLTSTGAVVLSGAISGPYNLTNSGTGSASMTLSGIIAASVGGITQSSSTSTLVLTGANTAFAGGVTVKAGTLLAQTSISALGTGTLVLGDVATNASDVTFTANVGGTTANNIVLASGTTGTITITSPNTGTLQVLSGSITGANNLTVAGTAAMGIQLSGSVNFTGALTANGSGAGAVVISGAIGSNVTSVTQNGLSQLTLSGTNLYTGLTTVNPGTTVSIGAGSTGGSIVGNVLNNGTLIFNRSNAYTYAGNITGSGALTKSGAGTLVLTGSNSYSGITTINAGALSASISSNNLVLNGGVLETSGSFTRALGTGSNQVLWTSGGFSAQGGALTVTLAGAPSPLVWDSTPSFLSAAGQLIFGSLTADNVVTLTHDLNLNDTGTPVTRTVQVVDNTGSTADKAVLSGIIAGGSNATLAKTGTGVLELTGANTYTGSTLVSAGTLLVSSLGGTGSASSSIGAGAAAVSLGSSTTTAGTLTYTGAGETTDHAIILAATTTGAGTLNSSGTGGLTWQGNVTSAGTTKTFTLGGSYTGASNIFSGVINLGTGNLTKADAGTWELTAANTFVNTTISAGTLKLSGSGTLGSGTLTLGGTAALTSTLDIGSGRTIAPTAITYTGTTGGSATITGAGALDLGSTSITVSVADNVANAVDMYWSMNTLTGSGTFIKTGTGTLDLSGIANNNFSGSIQVSAGSVLGASAGANLVLNGGVYEGSGSFTRSLGTTGSTVQWAAGANGGFAANGGALTVTINNSATPALVWDSTPQFVSGAGQLLFGSLTANNVVTFTNDIDLNNAVRTVQVVDNASSTADKAVLSGVLSNGSLTKTGNGTLQLSGSNTFTGAVTVTAGTLQFANMGNLGAGSSAIAMNGTTAVFSFVGGSNLTFNRGIALTTAGTLDASGTSGAVITYSSPITSDGQLTLRGSGAGIITGGITMSGVTSEIFVDSGTWTLSGTKSLVSDDVWVRGAGSVLNLNATNILGSNLGDDSSGIGAGQGGVINLNADNAIDPNMWAWLRLGTSDGTGAPAGYSVSPGSGTLNTNGFNLNLGTLGSVVLGSVDETYVGYITGSGTLTFNTTMSLFSGAIDANLAGIGTATKAGDGTVILRGDGTARTGTTTVNNGVLNLDYATNNARKLGSGALITLGGRLLLSGSSTVNSLETVGGLTVNAGGSEIQLQHGGSQTLTLQLGAITRAVGSGVNFTVSSNSSIETTAPALGAWATYGGNRFATLTGGVVTALAATAKNNLATWAAGDSLINTAAYTGTVGSLAINSLIVDAAAASTLTISAGNVLTLTSGGILMTENAGDTTISGGRLSSGLALAATGGELVIHQRSTTHDLTLGSSISGLTALTKVGAGTLVLTGSSNGAGRPVYVSEGTVRAVGGNAIGDFAAVTLSLNPSAVFDMTDTTERVGGLVGGSITVAGAGAVLLGTTGRLTVDARVDNSYNGTLGGGDGTVFVKMGTGTFITNSLRSEFTGRVIVNQGGIRLDGNTSGADVFSLAKALTLNGSNSHVISDQDQTASMNLLANAVAITLANTSAATGAQGLIVVGTQDGSRTESVGQTILLAGQNSIYANTAGGAVAARVAILGLSGLTRQNRSTLQLVGQNLGAAIGPAGRVTVTGGTIANLGGIGGGGAVDTTTISIVPYMTGLNAPTATAETSLYALSGNSFVTYDTNGFRPLNLTTEYEQLGAAGGVSLTSNVRFSSAANLTLNGGNKTMNSLLVDSTSTSAAITLAGAGGSLNVVSGAFLFTGTSTPQAITLSGFSAITTGAGNEYILHVMNTAAAGVTIASPFTTTAAALTKSGLGTLILTGTGSTYTGPTTVNLGILQIDGLANLGSSGSGGLVLNGGTLRFGTAFDPSAVQIRLGITATTDVATTVGGTLDTNGFDIVLASSIGQGGNGGLTKAGLGNLTLNAAANYTGSTTVNAGTLTFGVAQAVLASTDLVLGGGTLDNGSFTTALSRLYVSASTTLLNGANLTFNGTTEINGGAARTLTFTHTGGVTTFNGELFVLVDRGGTARTLTITGTGDVTINSQIVDGTFTGALTKTGTGTLTLTGDNAYSGTTNLNSSGALALGSNTALGTGTLILGTGTLSAVGGDRTLANAVQVSNNVTPTFTGTSSLTFTNTLSLLTSANNAVFVNTISGTGKALTFGNVTANALTATRNWTFNGTGDTVINGSITTSTAFLLNLIYTSSGSLTLGGANTAFGTAPTVIGSTAVAAGSVNVLAGSNIGTGALSILSGVLNLANTTQSITTLTMGNGPVGSTSGITLNGGSLSLGGDVTYTASTTSGTATLSGGTVNLLGDRTFTINDSTATTVEMQANVVLADGDATARSIIKAGTGTLVLSQAATYTGSTSINAGTLKFAAAQNLAGALQFGSASATTTAGTLDLSDASATFTSLVVQTNSATNTNNLIIGAGRTLTINGSVAIGTSAAASTTTLLTATGGGSLVVNNLTPTGLFQVGGVTSATSVGSKTVVDLSGLSQLTVSLNTTNGVFRVNPTNTNGASSKYSELTLAQNNTITAGILSVGDGAQNNGVVGQINSLYLGAGTNIFNVNTLNIGATNRDLGRIVFAGPTGTLTVNNTAGSGRTAFNMGTGQTTGAAAPETNTFDVRGHSATLLLGVVSIGSSNRGATYSNFFGFDTGTLDMTSLNMSTRTAETGNGLGLERNTTSTFNIGGGTVAIQSGITAMATAAGAYGTNPAPVMTATVNVSGGTVSIGATSGTSITMGNYTATGGTTTGGAVATVNLTGGVTTLAGNIVKGGTSALINASVILNGGTLNMTGRSIGAAGTGSVTFDARQGTVQNLGELNGGGTLTKTTAGRLVIAGTNTYTGATAVTEGIVQVGVAGTGSIATGQVTVASTATLAGSGTIGGSTLISTGAVLQPGDVTTVGTAATTVTDNRTLTFTAASTALTVQDGAQIRLGVSSPTLDVGGSVAFSNGQFQFNNHSYATASELFGSEPGALTAWNTAPTTATNHDMIKLVNGTLSIGNRAGASWGEGSVVVNGVLGTVQVGQVFNLIDWSGASLIGGNFDTGGSATYDATSNVIAGDLDLMALGAGYGWDVSAFAQYGIIVVVPEPSRALFLLVGLLGLALRRRRR